MDKNKISKYVCLMFFLGLGFSYFVSITQASIIVQSLPNAGLQAYWTFDSKTIDWVGNTVSDVSDNGNTGTLVYMDANSNQIIGKRAQAIYINGYDNSISLAANPISNVSQPNSVCAWVKDNDISQFPGGWYQTFLNLYGNNDNNISIGSVLNTGALFVTYKSGGSYYGAQSTGAVFVNNVWTHVCYVWGGNGLTLYTNGASIATTTNFDSAGSLNTIGARNNVGDGAWLGSIDDLRIYDRALSAKDVELIYKSGVLALNNATNKTVVMQKTPTNFLTNGLVGYWSFDGSKINWETNTATDSSGYGNDGTLTNMSTTTSPVQGKVGQGFNFDGVTHAYVSIPDNAAFDISQTGFSYSAWIKPSSFADTFNMFMGHYLPYFDVYNSGVLHFSMWAAGAQRSVSGTTILTLNKWQLATATYDSDGYMRVYLNGVQNGIGGPYLTPGNFDSNMYIGKWYSGSSYLFPGSIDDVRVYNRTLSASEIKQLYNQGR